MARAWRVTNPARGNALLADRAIEAAAFFSRLLGWMGKATIRPAEGLHLSPCNAIHTFFMRTPIDALFLDRQHRVVRAIGSLAPWRATAPFPKAYSVLELAPGRILATQTREGDVLSFEPTL